MHWAFFRMLPIILSLFFAILFIVFPDINAIPFCAIAICTCIGFSIYLWFPGVFIDYKKNLVIIRTFDALGILKIPIDKVESICVTDRKTKSIYSVEFCVKKKNGYVERREYTYLWRSILFEWARSKHIKKQVEAIFPPNE